MIKLNIQRFASTNKTTHYELSQYVGSDKPTYLTDYNQDMSRIDAGIYGAKSKADVNEIAIGDLTNLTTTAKTNLVGAINEVNGEVATNTANISTNTSNISTNSTNIGNLSNLTTASKTNLVSAINEVDANCDSNSSSIATNTLAIGDLTSLNTTVKTDLVSAINEVNTKVDAYSTSESLTSKVWVDGKPIYRKVIVDTTSRNAGNYNIAHGITGIENISRLEVMTWQNSTTMFVASSTSPLNGSERATSYLDGDHIAIRNAWASIKNVIIIEYTKTDI